MKNILLFLLIPILSFGQTQIGQDINGEAEDDFSGESVSLSSDGSIVAIGASSNDGINGANSGHVRIYEDINGTWVQIGQDIDGEAIADLSGRNVSISGDGNVVAIGATSNDDNGADSGHVRIYENIGGIWIQIGDDIDGETETDFSGDSVSISNDGSVVAIGAPLNGSNVRVYENQGGDWVQIGDDIDGESGADQSGRSVSISNDGSVVAIGAPLNDGLNGEDSGHVRVYENIGNNWVQIGSDIDGEAAGDRSGNSVSMSSDGDVVAIGAALNDDNGADSGHVRIYENQGGTWTQVGDDIDGEAQMDLSGMSISLSSAGNVVAIGAPLNNGNDADSGHVRVFQNQGGTWVQVGTEIDGEVADDRLGTSISLSSNGSIVAIGAPGNIEATDGIIGDDINGENSGYVGVYDLDGLLSTEEVTATNFSIFPNPSQNIVSISLSNSDILQKATIYNNLGQEVLVSTQNSIDVSSLSKGVYILEVETARGKGSEKLIIN